MGHVEGPGRRPRQRTPGSGRLPTVASGPTRESCRVRNSRRDLILPMTSTSENFFFLDTALVKEEIHLWTDPGQVT